MADLDQPRRDILAVPSNKTAGVEVQEDGGVLGEVWAGVHIAPKGHAVLVRVNVCLHMEACRRRLSRDWSRGGVPWLVVQGIVGGREG